ncbi:MAG: hypothetical protein IPM92_11050 [Saprospiraceae bacterium]|nr:hypothetical protein [Saprospiraceae bacterium]
MPTSKKNNKEFIINLYSKHETLIKQYKESNQQELQEEILNQGFKFNNNENSTNEIKLFTNESISKAVAYTISTPNIGKKNEE